MKTHNIGMARAWEYEIIERGFDVAEVPLEDDKQVDITNCGEHTVPICRLQCALAPLYPVLCGVQA